MFQFTINKNPLYSSKHVWFYDGKEDIKLASNTIFFCSKKYDKEEAIYIKNTQTGILDLNRSKDDLFAGITSETTRRHIRQARKHDMEVEFIYNPDEAELKKYIDTINAFHASKDLPLAKWKYVKALGTSGSFVITHVKHEGEILSSHTYINDGERFSLVNSYNGVSEEKNKLRAIANKLLHIEVIYHAKDKGFKTYDFGGLDEKNVPGVYRFKMSFGPTVEDRYEYMIAKGLYKLVWKFRKMIGK